MIWQRFLLETLQRYEQKYKLSWRNCSVNNNLNLTLFSDEPLLTRPSFSLSEHLTFKANKEQGRHGWLRLTPAYSVHLVNELVSHCSQEDFVLDPFCGTGTTALVCAQNGIACHTIDINPFLVWLANAKFATYSQADIEVARRIAHIISTEVEDIDHTAWIPPIKDIDKWWEPATLRVLARALEVIRHTTSCEQVRFLLSIIFCRVSIEMAGVSFGHQSMSFKKQEREATLFDISATTRFQHLFWQVGNEVLASAGAHIREGCARAFVGDSRQLSSILPARKYTTVITSPPYPNRISYIRELRPYMYWLGYLESGQQAGEIDWQAIGGTWGCATSNLMRWMPDPDIQIPYDNFNIVLAQIAQKSQVLSLYVAKYFEDIVQHIHSLKQVLAPEAQVYYVVGNSKFYDVMLHTEQIYAAILEAEGFQNIRIDTIRKRTSKKELFEYVVSASL
jgi:hypothetical protein